MIEITFSCNPFLEGNVQMHIYTKSILAIALCLAGFLSPVRVNAQTESTPELLQAAEQQLMATLDKVRGLIYKREELDDGTSRIQVAFEHEGETTKFVLLVRYLGYYGKKPIYSVMIYALITESTKSFPPAVIKMVAVKADNCSVGGMLMTEDFSKVYLATKMPCDSLKDGEIWISLALMHEMRVTVKKEIEAIVGAAVSK
jgi:hypothetical protein